MFCFFGRKTLPGVYDESLSYYEQLCALEKRIDTIQLEGGYSLECNVEVTSDDTVLTSIKLNDKKYRVDSSGMANPMTTAGDIIVGGESGAATRLGKGNNGDVLKIKNGAVAWDEPDTQTVEGTDVKSTGETNGKVLTANGSGGATWETPASGGMTNPMSNTGDIIVGGVDGDPTALPKGANGKVLGVSGGNVQWVTPDKGMDNPMLYVGDMIVGDTSGNPSRVGIGNNGQVLTAREGTPSWEIPTVEGYDVKSSNAANNRVLRSDGAGGATWSMADKNSISSSGATNGQVLTANGTGGCAWITP